MKYGLAFSVFVACLIVLLAGALCWVFIKNVQRNPSEWDSLAPMPTARSEISAAVLNQQIYIAGGISPFTSNTFERYDIRSNRWQTLSNLPAARHHVAMAALNKEIYAVGGFSSLAFTSTAKAWSYSPETERWRPIAELPEARGEHAVVAVNQNLYVLAGSSLRSREVWQYSLTGEHAEQWVTTGELMPTARDSAAAAALGTSIWAIGGRHRDTGDLAVVEIFDTATGQWSAGPELPLPRAGHAAAALGNDLGNDIFVFGGETLASATVHAEVFKLTPTADNADTWKVIGKLPIARHGLAGVSEAGKIFAIGGGTRAGLRTPFSLSADNAAIELEPQ